jgi:tetratricopeptide (TPR) repeat protein
MNNKGNALDSLERYDEAIECYNKALAIDPNYTKALNNKKAANKLKM